MSKEAKINLLFWMILLSVSGIIVLTTEFKYGVIFLLSIAALNWLFALIKLESKGD